MHLYALIEPGRNFMFNLPGMKHPVTVVLLNDCMSVAFEV